MKREVLHTWTDESWTVTVTPSRIVPNFPDAFMRGKGRRRLAQ